MRQFRITPLVKNATASIYKKNGLFCLWDELLSVKGMTILPLQKACQSTTNSKHVQQTKRRKVPLDKKIYPNLNSTIVKNDTKVLGIHVRQNLLCWAIVQGNGTIQDWNCKHLDQQLPVANIYELAKMTSMIPDTLEACDIYVMEESRSMSGSNRRMMQMKVQIDTMYAILMASILQKKKTIEMPEDENNIHIMSSGTTVQHFNLKIGNDIVTTNYLIDPMLAKVRVRTHWKDQYFSKQKREKEEMGWALLNTLAFIEIYNNLQMSKNSNENISNLI